MKRIIVLLTLLLILTSGCNSVEMSKESNLRGINIFDNNSDLITDYKPKETIILNEITDKNYEEATLIYSSGKIKSLPVNKDGEFILELNNTQDIIGIYLYNNFKSITDAFYETKESLDNDEKVMTVLLDGFSLGQYKFAVENNYMNFTRKYYRNEALSVYTPVTNAGYAAIITGKTPDINGIHDRSNREIMVDSIFQYTLDNKKKTVLLEGDIKILNTEIEPVLHVDINKDGNTDDEMYESVVAAAYENYDFVFAHFHGIDDRGHSYGPYSDEAMNYINKMDNYIKQLSEVWDGKIILTADHGMHETLEGGSHGDCRSSDMIVPYFIIE